uniref:Flagellum associated containing coiled-coil domains 1 n=1 Tax=Rattus norvegicus TaxID=10116 RepID=A0A8I6AM75_RAT
MYPNPLIYCTCWDPWNLGPRKLIKTPHPLPKASIRKPIFPAPISREPNYLLSQPAKSTAFPRDKAQSRKLEESNKAPSEVIEVSPGYKLVRNREQISVTLGDEMFSRKKHLESGILSKVKISRSDIISDLEEQISELSAIIEQMNRDHQSAQKLLSNEMDLRCADMKQKFETESRELKQTHKEQLEKLENSYKETLKVEKAAAQEKLDEMGKEYKYLKNMFHMYQDSIYDEMEDKWSRRKAEWEKDEKMEREKILLQQKHRITKKFELESEEEKRKMNESFSTVMENFTREKEELIRQHNEDILQMQELRKAKEVSIPIRLCESSIFKAIHPWGNEMNFTQTSKI